MSQADSSAHPRLFMIRHGETHWTESHQHTASTDIPLNELGEARAVLLAARLSGINFGRVFTSPLARVRRTCDRAGFEVQARTNPDPMEWRMGDDKGRTTAQIREDRPKWDLFRDGPADGETLAGVTARAESFIALARECAGDVAAFASGQITSCIAASWLGLPPTAARLFRVDTCSVGILYFEHNFNEPVVSFWNELRPSAVFTRSEI